MALPLEEVTTARQVLHSLRIKIYSRYCCYWLCGSSYLDNSQSYMSIIAEHYPSKAVMV